MEALYVNYVLSPGAGRVPAVFQPWGLLGVGAKHRRWRNGTDILPRGRRSRTPRAIVRAFYFFPALFRPGRIYSKVSLNDAATGYRILDYSLPD
jgi:hypothetical protein